MKKFFNDFKNFISRGNVLDLAVGMIIGNAFTTIVKSLVNDILMPIIGIFGGKEIGEWKATLVKPTIDGITGEEVGGVFLYYGNFIQAIIDFLLIALTLFIIIKVVTVLHNKRVALENKLRHKEEAEAQAEPEPVKEPEPSPEIVLLTEIRDALVKKDESK